MTSFIIIIIIIVEYHDTIFYASAIYEDYYELIKSYLFWFRGFGWDDKRSWNSLL